MLKKISIILLLATAIGSFFFYSSKAEEVVGLRTDSNWNDRGTYIETAFTAGRNILINGTNRYLNFNTTVGTSGYGIRDNAGDIEFKNSGGSWTAFGTSGGSGTVTSVGQIAPTGLVVTTTGGTTDATSTWAWASGYEPLKTASSSNWNTFYDTPSNRITAGDYLSWSSNTLNLDSILGSAGSPLTAGYFTNLYASSTETGTLYITGSVKPGPLNLSTSTPPDLRYEYDTDTGLGWVSDNSQALYTGGTARLTIDGSGLVTTANSTSTLLTVNTQWVDNEICFSNGQCMSAPSITGSEITFFHHNSASEFAGYERLYTYPPAGTEIDESCSADADIAGGYCSIDSYISTTTDIMIASFPAGTWDFRKFTYVSNTGGNSKLESTVFKRDTVGTETFLFQATSTDINILATGLVDYTSAQSSISFNSNGTDRLVIKLKGWTDSTAARVIHHVYGSSNHYSRTITPLMIENTGVTNAFHDETIYGNWTHSGLLTFGNATGTSLTVNGSTYLATTGGNVGIGTTTPLNILQIASTNPKFYISDTDASANYKHWFINSSNGDFMIGTTSDSLAVNANVFQIASTSDITTFGKVISPITSQGINIASSSSLLETGFMSSGTTTIEYFNDDWKNIISSIGCAASSTGSFLMRIGDGVNWMPAQTCGAKETLTYTAQATNNLFTAGEPFKIQIGTKSGDPNQFIIKWNKYRIK